MESLAEEKLSGMTQIGDYPFRQPAPSCQKMTFKAN